MIFDEPDKSLLYIEPRHPAAAEALVDHLTRKMSAAFRQGGPVPGAWGGVHECVCGALSTNRDYRLPSRDLTNSLCVHYLAHHRSEVPPEQLARVNEFTFGEAEPNEQELQGPEPVLNRIRESVEDYLGPDRLGTWVAWGLDTAALYRGLQGGRLSYAGAATTARQDAEALLSILCAIEAVALPRLCESVLRMHEDVRLWGADALCVPGWKREAWATPLADLMKSAGGDLMHRRSIAMRFRLLGPHAGAAAPALFELAMGATGDLQHDVALALGDMKRTPGLLVPPAAVPSLLELAQGSTRYPELQIPAALVLARAGHDPTYAVRALVRMALEGNRDFEYAAAVLCGTLNQTVGYVGEPGIEGWGTLALPILLEALQACDWQVRLRAIKLLGRAGPDAGEAVPYLEKAGEDPKLRSHVEEAMVRITSPATADRMIEQMRTAEKAKARVVVPPIDPNKPRHSQFFRFICPFCPHSEVVGLWHTLKRCSNCDKVINIISQPGCSGCELIDSPGPVTDPAAALVARARARRHPLGPCRPAP